MTIFAVEENTAALQQLSELVTGLSPESELLCFESSLAALAAARNKEVDLALISVELSGLSGLDLGQYLQELYPLVNLIYLSEDRSHGYDAMSQHASGYLLTPVAKEGLSHELDDLRHPALLENRLFSNIQRQRKSSPFLSITAAHRQRMENLSPPYGKMMAIRRKNPRICPISARTFRIRSRN